MFDQSRTPRIAPSFSIEMQTEHNIRMQFCVHQHRPSTNFAEAIKQNFTLPPNGVFLFRIIRIQKLRSRLRDTIFDQNLLRQLFEIIRPHGRDWFRVLANKRDARAECFQSRRQHPGYVQRQITFLDRRRLTDPKPALLHFCPGTAEMSRIERDMKASQWFRRLCRWQRSSRTPKSRHRRFGIFVRGKAQCEKFVFLAVDENPGGFFLDEYQAFRHPVGAVDVLNEIGEFIARDCFVVFLQHLPFGRRSQNSKIFRGKSRERKGSDKKRREGQETSRDKE